MSNSNDAKVVIPARELLLHKIIKESQYYLELERKLKIHNTVLSMFR